VGAVVLGDYLHLCEGDTVKCTNRLMEVPVGEAMLGRVVNTTVFSMAPCSSNLRTTAATEESF
jgi:F0F1-type ATP synthase alpha subunit